jgi:hypothetical protein
VPTLFILSLTLQTASLNSLYPSLPVKSTAVSSLLFGPSQGASPPSELSHNSFSATKIDTKSENLNDRSGLFQLKSIQQRSFSEQETNILNLLGSVMYPATPETAMEAARQLDFFCPPLDPGNEEVEPYLWAIWEVMAEVAGSPEVTTEIHVWLVDIFQSLVLCAKGNVVVWGVSTFKFDSEGPS